MTPIQQLTSVLTTALGGLRIDYVTVSVAVIGLVVLLVAFEYLRDIVVGHAESMSVRRDEAAGDKINWLRSDKSKTRFQQDVLDARYRRLVNRASRR